MQTRSKGPVPNPPQNQTHSAITKTTKEPNLDITIPKTINQAMCNQNWRAACDEEMNAQLRNLTFELVPKPGDKSVIATKWIFTLKYSPNGSISRYKARLVARGFNQKYGVDYAETFSPVVKSVTIRLVLQLAVTGSWVIKQLDINNAFLQGTLEDEVYVTQPPGYIDQDRPDYVWRLKKALYGLKQAPRAWYIELKTALLAYGFQNSLADTSVFIYIHGNEVLYVLVYVDDIIVTGNTNSLISSFLQALAQRFSLKDPTDLTYFLGIEATRTANGLHLMQRKYAIDLLTKANMLDCKPVNTPMAPTPKLTIRDGTPLKDASQYRRVLGGLQYLSFTRPDLAFAVNRLSQFMHQPTDVHWQAVKRVLRYLSGTLSTGIFLRKSSPTVLHAFSDSDWGGDSHDYLSTNAHVIYFGSTPIAWSSRKQKGVARSSTEAEYRGVADTASQIRWVNSLMSELGIKLPTPPVIYCDNVGATYLCANPVFHSRMKHLALDYHFIRDLIQSGELRVTHVSTKDQLADALTKPLPRPRFRELMIKIGVTNAPPS
ncbi:Retrovirus-related Pol polyprotein from transposon RE2 [Cardamine amara subsp. amara]|uniref:Retrovirus-related Pol polyprotein from transposon RE2 n=1 Tax=Cardamine amara subsp. amara TaxID=228776 RepID=A0ABD1BVF6_CARAN